MMNVAQRCSIEIVSATLYYVIALRPSAVETGQKSSVLLLNSENIMYTKSPHSKKLREFKEINPFELKEKIEQTIKASNQVHYNSKCEGVYCNYKEILVNALIDEKDELNNLYLMDDEQKETLKKVEYKSIILDIVEKSNTYKRLGIYTKIPEDKILRMKQGLLLRFRKFFTINDLKDDPTFSHFHYAHFYQKKQVCGICFAMYNKLDHLRNEARNTMNYFVKNPGQITDEIQKYENEIGIAYDNYKMEDKQVFSEDFYQRLEKFDEPQVPLALHNIDETVFEKTIIKEVCKSQLRRVKRLAKPQPLKVRKELIRGANGTSFQPGINANK